MILIKVIDLKDISEKDAEISISGHSLSEINLGAENDTVNIEGTATKSINLGDGDNRLQIDGSATGDVVSGSGNDQIDIGSHSDRVVDTGAGDDIVNIGGTASGDVNLGDGDDELSIGNNFTRNIDGGDGNDTLQLNMTKSTYDTHYQSKVSNFETIILKDGAYVNGVFDSNYSRNVTDLDDIKDVSFSNDSITEYKYNITLNAGLTDTDGSESLSSITISNLPSGTSLSGLTANTDGSYTISTDTNGDAKITLISENELDSSVLNAITASVTSIESNGKDTATVTTTAKIEIDGTDGNDTIDGTDADEVIDGGTGADTIDAGAGNDSIVFDASDTVDGGIGFDTLVAIEDINIDLSALDDKISNIEVIDLNNNESNNITLSLEDVLTVTDTDNLLRIDGDNNDTIHINTQGDDAEWTLGDFQPNNEVAGESYNVYTNNDNTVTLEISTQITIEES
jgi:Ca2+-binding RTX toxin-like protein